MAATAETDWLSDSEMQLVPSGYQPHLDRRKLIAFGTHDF